MLSAPPLPPLLRRWRRAGFGLAAAVLLAGCGGAPSNEAEPAPAGEESAGTAGMAGMAHGDHAPRYGGYVFMHGDLHFEVVLGRDGEHRLYFSDATRSELPAAVVEDVRLTIRRGDGDAAILEPLRPEIDEFGESWIARSDPVSEDDAAAAILYFRFEGAPYEIEVPFVMAPFDPDLDPHRMP